MQLHGIDFAENTGSGIFLRVGQGNEAGTGQPAPG